jgi:hypothetical protein
MENAVIDRLQSIQLAEPQVFRNIAIVPLLTSADGVFQYRTLGEALTTWDVAITEVSDAGSVPELQVVNRSQRSVLLIDGEELAGAKQNRVLNTSILLKENSSTRIPVSCTEQGRWSYVSKVFSESGNVMAYKTRSRKTRSVHCSLEAAAGYQSNQGEVWDGIAALQAKANAPSSTSAMSDVFKAREEELHRGAEIFKLLPNQVGLVALVGEAPVGADLVSLGAAYAKLHAKLVRSYTLEGLLDMKEPCAGTSAISKRARDFLDEVVHAEAQQFPSVGYGSDFRFKRQGLAGTALVHENEVIHAALFRMDEPDRSAGMASCTQRRRRFKE